MTPIPHLLLSLKTSERVTLCRRKREEFGMKVPPGSRVVVCWPFLASKASRFEEWLDSGTEGVYLGDNKFVFEFGFAFLRLIDGDTLTDDEEHMLHGHLQPVRRVHEIDSETAELSLALLR